MPRILLIEDDEDTAELFGVVLRAAGHEVVVSGDGEQALALAMGARFDLVITDHLLPGRDGLSILEALRLARPTLPALFLSASLDTALAKQAVNDVGAVGVLLKPTSPAALMTEVNRVLSRVKPTTPVAWSHMSEEGQMVARCLAGDGLRLALQPVVTAKGAAVVGFEGLLRSDHPILSSPRVLLSAAERQNMLPEIGNAVVGRAAEWLFRLPDDTRLFLNLHPEDLRDVHVLMGRLEPLEPWSGRITLDLTGECYERWPDLHGRVTALRRQGFTISLDDLGDGPGALSLLAELGPDFMKLDPSLVRNLDGSSRKRRLVEMLCNFAQATDAVVLAEGVETRPEAGALQDLGVNLLQGYLFGRPSVEMPSGQTTVTLRDIPPS